MHTHTDTHAILRAVDIYIQVSSVLTERAKFEGEPVILGEDVPVVHPVLGQKLLEKGGEATRLVTTPAGK